MTIPQQYLYISKIRSKLSQCALARHHHRELDLRKMVGHANLLDRILDEIDEIDSELVLCNGNNGPSAAEAHSVSSTASDSSPLTNNIRPISIMWPLCIFFPLLRTFLRRASARHRIRMLNHARITKEKNSYSSSFKKARDNRLLSHIIFIRAHIYAHICLYTYTFRRVFFYPVFLSGPKYIKGNIIFDITQRNITV